MHQAKWVLRGKGVLLREKPPTQRKVKCSHLLLLAPSPSAGLRAAGG